MISHFFSPTDKEVALGHRPSNKLKNDKVPLVSWEPYFCVLLQDEQTFTAYRSEEMAVRNLFHPKQKNYTVLFLRCHLVADEMCAHNKFNLNIININLNINIVNFFFWFSISNFLVILFVYFFF